MISLQDIDGHYDDRSRETPAAVCADLACTTCWGVFFWRKSPGKYLPKRSRVDRYEHLEGGVPLAPATMGERRGIITTKKYRDAMMSEANERKHGYKFERLCGLNK